MTIGQGPLARYVVAHNRDRDFYQLALAFDEVGALAALVTDYVVDEERWLHRHGMARVLRGRQRPGIEPRLVRTAPAAVLLQMIDRADRWTGTDWMLKVERVLATAAAKAALADPGADLMLYHGCALEAFRLPALAGRRRHLFLFHPHPRLTQAILRRDFDRFGVGASSLREEAEVGPRVDRLDAELALADHVLCASSLSAKSIAFADVTDAPVSTIPYGAAGGRVGAPAQARAAAPVRFLFVGQAIQRKGLHHLLRVWRTLKPAGAELVLVCSRNPDGILDDVPEGVEIHANIANDALSELYLSAHCFVLPALVEGFGLVLLEALRAGCFTIFSDATGLADCAVPAFAGREVPAGDLDALGAAIEAAIAMAAARTIDHAAIAGYAQTRSPERFRAQIRDATAAARALPLRRAATPG